jgi:hypothetical protein
MKWIALLAILAVALGVGAYFMSPHSHPGDGIRADTTCRKLLAEKENREALSWLEQSKPGNIRTIGEQNPEESLKIVKNLYAAGAVKAHVVGIERDPQYGETTNIVCVELPVDHASRKQLFHIEAKVASNEGFDPVLDEGQTYLFLYKFKLSLGQYIRSLLHT